MLLVAQRCMIPKKKEVNELERDQCSAETEISILSVYDVPPPPPKGQELGNIKLKFHVNVTEMLSQETQTKGTKDT